MEALFEKSDNESKLKYRHEIQSEIGSYLVQKLAPVENNSSKNLHCFIFVNGLAEFAKLNSKTLSERSHFQLLIDVCERNQFHNIYTTLVDVRHPGRCALFAGRESQENHKIMASLPFKSNANDKEILQVYKDAAKRLIKEKDDIDYIDFKIISTSDENSLAEFLEHSYLEIRKLFKAVDKSIYSIHAGGILAPYLLETFLEKIGGNHYFYQFSYLNTSFSLSVYKALLSPRVDLPVNPNSQCLLRPGNIRLSDDFTSADQNCINFINQYSEKNIILSMGRGVANQLDSNFINYLSELKLIMPNLVYAYFSEVRHKPLGVTSVEKLGIHTISIGYAPNLFQCLKKLNNLNIVVFNPMHFGNGGCLLQAAQAEIPVIICEGNDSGNWHPNNHIVKTEGDAVLTSYDLFSSKIFRSQWITDSLQKIKIETTRCANSLDAIISEQKVKKKSRKIFVVGNNKTGTTSLQKFLNSIGYHVAPQRPAVRMYIKHLAEETNIWPDLSLFIEKYDGFQDLPFADKNLLKQLVKHYPKALFIYSMRDSFAWYNSFLKHHSRIFKFQVFDDGGVWTPSNQQQMIQNLKNSKLVEEDALSIGEIHMLRFGLENEEELFDREIYMRHHANHEKNALKILREKSHLLIDVTRDTRIEMKICDFLGIEPPSDQQFPHLNLSQGLAP
jgi:hypothetical protein